MGRLRQGSRNARLLALTAIVAALVAIVVVVVSTQGGASQRAAASVARHRSHRDRHPTTRTKASKHHPSKPRPPAAAGPPYPVAHITRVFVDHTRTVRLSSGTVIPRHLRTLIFYPAVKSGQAFPLLVFGHGFAVTPLTYGPLLKFWASQGFVVAAPFFPLESHNAPGGPNESDLPNQPRDLSFVISRTLRLSGKASGPLAHRIASNEIAVTGQSDGGDTALAAAYATGHRDPRIKAAMILSGAEIPGAPLTYFQTQGPPLLAVQGTADTINPPSLTAKFFAAAHPPKYLLSLIGAKHLAPYQRRPDLGIVEQISVEFLRRYLEGDRSAGSDLTRLSAQPHGGWTLTR